MSGESGHIWRRVVGLAARQHGAVARRQLIQLGLSSDAIDHRLAASHLQRAHRGVYWLGPPGASLEAQAMAAVLACGERAAVSHRSAARLWRLLPYPAHPTPVEVTVAGRTLDPRPGIEIHRAVALHHRDRRLLGAIPLTSPARTLLDLAAAGDRAELEQAFDEAVFHRLVRVGHLRELLARCSGRRGVSRLRRLVDAEDAGERNRREAEMRMAALIRAADLPLPRPNARIGAFVVDFLWREQRVVLEIDGFATHSRRTMFEADRARDAELLARGYRVLRVTWRQLRDRPHAVVARIAGVLARSGGEPALG